MTDTLRDKLIQKGWVTEFNADTLTRLIEEHYAELLQRQAQLEAAVKPRKCLIEPPSWCDDGQAHAWHAGWEARDEMLLQPWPPVPVSERLPGPEDCDAEGRCWIGRPEYDFPMGDTGKYGHANPEWCLEPPADSASVWLPAHALPLPEVSE